MLRVTCVDTSQYHEDRISHIYTDLTIMCLELGLEYTYVWNKLVANYENGCYTTIFDKIFLVQILEM